MKPKPSSKDLRKTPRRQKEAYYSKDSQGGTAEEKGRRNMYLLLHKKF